MTWLRRPSVTLALVATCACNLSDLTAGSPSHDAGGDVSSNLGGTGALGWAGNGGQAASWGQAGSGGSSSGGSAGADAAPQDAAKDAPDAPDAASIGPCGIGFDDFNDGTLLTSFTKVGDGSVTESGGLLELILKPTTTSTAGFSTPKSDLRECHVTLEVVSPVAMEGVTTSLALDAEPSVPDGIATFNMVHAELYFQLGAVQSKPVVYDAVLHRWWRIASQAGQTVFSTSKDGTVWKAQWSNPTPSSFAVGRAQVRVNSWQSPKAGTTKIDNFNL